MDWSSVPRSIWIWVLSMREWWTSGKRQWPSRPTKPSEFFLTVGLWRAKTRWECKIVRVGLKDWKNKAWAKGEAGLYLSICWWKLSFQESRVMVLRLFFLFYRKWYSQKTINSPFTYLLSIQFTFTTYSHLPGTVLGPGNTKVNKAKPLRDCPAFILFLRHVCCVSLGTGDRASSGDNWPPLLSHTTIQTQEPSEPVNQMVNDFDIHKSNTFLHFPGDWGGDEKEI